MSSEFIITTNIAGFKYFLKIEDRGGVSYQGLKNNATIFIDYETANTSKNNLSSAFDLEVEPDPFIYPIRQPIGCRLKEVREGLGFTQKYVAEKIDCGLAIYRAYEHERAVPSNDRLIIISQFYGITIDELVKGKKVLSANKC
jgi:ribosome-binding protein aMBF1 (putative translation factor)